MASQFGIFGPTPEQIRRAEQDRRDQAFAQQAQGMGIYGPLYQASRRLSSRGISRLGQSLFPQPQTPELQKAAALQQLKQQYSGVDLTDPNNIMKLARDLSSVGATEEAMVVAERAKKMMPEKVSTEEQAKAAIFRISQIPVEQRTAEQSTILTAAEAALGRDKEPKFANQTEKALYEGFLDETGGDEFQAAKKLSEFKSSLRQREAAAGVPGSGELKMTDLNIANNIVEGLTKDSKERLSTVGRLRTLLSEANAGSGTAVAQMRRELVKLVGDSQIGQGEVRDALGSLGIVGDVVSGINQVFTGTPSKEKLADVQRVITALENNVAKSYNSSIQRSEKVLTQGRLKKEAIDNILPPKYTPASAKKKTQFVEGKIYKDAKGNRAVFRNGKFEPVQ